MPAPATVLHSNAVRTGIANYVKTQLETGSGDMVCEVYDDADLLLASFSLGAFSSVVDFSISVTDDPSPETNSEMFGAGDKTPTYAIIKNKDGVEIFRTPGVTTSPASFPENTIVRLTNLSYVAAA